MSALPLIDTVVQHFTAPPLPDTPSIRALQADWDETGMLIDAARERYRRHGNARLFGVECRAIIEREVKP